MSGHSKWSTIKHKKAANDSRRGKLFSKLIKEITASARIGGGDVDTNPRLRTAIAAAKIEAMSRMITSNKAILRGTGELEGETYEEILYEGYGPGRCRGDGRSLDRQPQSRSCGNSTRFY